MAMNVQPISTLSDRVNQIRMLTAEIVNREILPNENKLWHGRRSGLSGGRRSGLPEDLGAALHRAPDPKLASLGWKDRKAIAKELKSVYTADTESAAEAALDAFEAKLGDSYPMIVSSWRSNWERVIPFLAFPEGHPEADLHDGRDRVARVGAVQDGSNSRALSVRPGRDEAVVSRDAACGEEMDEANQILASSPESIRATFRRKASRLKS